MIPSHDVVLVGGGGAGLRAAIAIAEVKGVIPQADPHHPLGGAKGRRH